MAKVKQAELDKIQIRIEPETLRRIDFLAERMNLSRQKFFDLLLTQALDDEQWLIELVSSKYVAPVVKAIRSGLRRGERRGKAAMAGVTGEAGQGGKG